MAGPRPIATLLVANRGEIACRIIAAARHRGLRTIALHEDEDAAGRHVALADRSVRIAARRPGGIAFLEIDTIVDAALRLGADAIHPGYGFLSENAGLARACAAAGLVFVGPPADAIDALGNKARAKRLAQSLGIACLDLAAASVDAVGGHGSRGRDGSAGPGDVDALVAAAVLRGGPLDPPWLLKAAAGGGGRGMRVVARAEELQAAVAVARREASASFGSDELLVEPYVRDARHVEIQFLADHHGRVLHLGERDCSTQRRHQKIVEEAPAPGLAEATRAAMGEAACRLARAAGYVGAGTAEFLLGTDGRFWFLEVNARLQVEHPVTEAVTGIDLVDWQLRIAAGEALDLDQADVRRRGHAIEVRLCAEDPAAGFLPSSGPIHEWRLPTTLPGVRIEHGLGTPAGVPARYDSLIAKLIAHGTDRDEARRRLLAALRATRVFGVTTNRDFLIGVLGHPVFMQAGAAAPTGTDPANRPPDDPAPLVFGTRWLERAGLADATGVDARASDRWLAAAIAVYLDAAAAGHGALADWTAAVPPVLTLHLQVDGAPLACVVARGPDGIDVRRQADGAIAHRVAFDGRRFVIDGEPCEGAWRMLDTYPDRAALVAGLRSEGWLDLGGICKAFGIVAAPALDPDARQADRRLTAQMHAVVAGLYVADGDAVEAGQLLMHLEAMKMQHPIAAPAAGRVDGLTLAAGDRVKPGQHLVEIVPVAAPS